MIVFLRRTAVCARYGISRSTLYAWIQKQLFPPPVKLGPRMVGWPVDALERWERERTTSEQLSPGKKAARASSLASSGRAMMP